MERRRDRQWHSTLGTHLLSDSDCAVDRALVTRQHNLRGVVIVGDRADFALRGRRCDALGQIEIGTQECRHCAHSDRNRRLHRLAAKLE